MAFGTRLLDGAGTVLGKLSQKYGIAGSTEGVLHVAQYPVAFGAADGAFKSGLVSGTMAAGLAAGSEVFQLRWTSATFYCLVRSVKLSATVAGTAFAAGAPQFNLHIARSWTVDGSGGNAATLTGNSLKARTDFNTSVMGAIRVASTAALVVGTKTNDASAISSVFGVTGTATTGQIVAPDTALYNRVTPDEYPVLLESNEGLVIKATVPATGTWSLAVSVEWSEVAIANF
jgi:hypothetical protein